MWKLIFVLAALGVSASPVDARDRTLELYGDESSEPALPGSSFAAGRAPKKR